MSQTSRRFPKNTGFAQIIDQAVATCPQRVAVVSDGLRLTYQELDAASSRLALALEREGVGPGEPVGVISRNCAEFLLAELAILKLGAVAVKISWRLSPDEIQYIIELNSLRYVFLRPEREDWGEQVRQRNRGKVKFYALTPLRPGETAPFWQMIESAPSAQAFLPRPVEPDSPAFRIHTSGTTGRPKCVLHSHAHMLEQLQRVLAVLPYQPGDVYQMISQLFHVSSMGAYMVLATGGTLVLMHHFDPTEYMESLVREGVTGVGVIPVVLKCLLGHPDFYKYDLSRLRFLNYSTCPISQSLLEEALDKLGCDFYQSYGMTEMASVLTVLTPPDHFSDHGSHLASVGKPIPGVEIQIQDFQGSPLPPGVTGEIVAKGAGQMCSYYNADPEANLRALRDGWYHTGDVGYLDEKGFLFVQGRKDDMIISGGENIYPKEVADAIAMLGEDVAEVAVYGVPDDKWGELVKASVVRKPGSTLTVEQLREYCLANIPRYKVPKEFEFLPELPKNGTGKVLIPLLREASMQKKKQSKESLQERSVYHGAEKLSAGDRREGGCRPHRQPAREA